MRIVINKPVVRTVVISRGVRGASGKSAYEVAVDGGFSGSIQDWLASLQGVDGESAYEIAVDNGFSGSEQDWLDSLQGAGGAAYTFGGGLTETNGNVVLGGTFSGSASVVSGAFDNGSALIIASDSLFISNAGGKTPGIREVAVSEYGSRFTSSDDDAGTVAEVFVRNDTIEMFVENGGGYGTLSLEPGAIGVSDFPSDRDDSGDVEPENFLYTDDEGYLKSAPLTEISGGASYTFSDGLTESSGTVTLGGNIPTGSSASVTHDAGHNLDISDMWVAIGEMDLDSGTIFGFVASRAMGDIVGMFNTPASTIQVEENTINIQSDDIYITADNTFSVEADAIILDGIVDSTQDINVAPPSTFLYKETGGNKLASAPLPTTQAHMQFRDATSPFDWPTRITSPGHVIWVDLTGETPSDPPDWVPGDLLYEGGQ